MKFIIYASCENFSNILVTGETLPDFLYTCINRFVFILSVWLYFLSQARYREHIEATYGADPSTQIEGVDTLAYQFAVGEPNKGRYYGLGSALTAGRYLPHESHDSTSIPSDDAVGSDSDPLAPTAHPDERLLRWIEELETCDQARQMEIVRLQQEMTSQMREEAEAQDRRLQEEAETRDRRLMQSLNEREQRTRDWWTEEADRRDEMMLR